MRTMTYLNAMEKAHYYELRDWTEKYGRQYYKFRKKLLQKIEGFEKFHADYLPYLAIHGAIDAKTTYKDKP